MGFDTQNKKALPIPAILHQLEIVQNKALTSTQVESFLMYKAGALIAIKTAVSLRGHKGFYLNVAITQSKLDIR